MTESFFYFSNSYLFTFTRLLLEMHTNTDTLVLYWFCACFRKFCYIWYYGFKNLFYVTLRGTKCFTFKLPRDLQFAMRIRALSHTRIHVSVLPKSLAPALPCAHRSVRSYLKNSVCSHYTGLSLLHVPGITFFCTLTVMRTFHPSGLLISSDLIF